MKYLFLFLLFFSFTGFSQKKSRTIRKAEKSYYKGNLDKTLRLLDKAENIKEMSGAQQASVWDISINKLRSQVSFDREEYAQARAHLDSIPNFITNGAYDSLKWRTLQLQMGNDFVSKKIDESLSELIYTEDSINFEDNVQITFHEDAILHFKTSFRTGMQYNFKKVPISVRKQEWIETFKATSVYEMLKNPS